MFTQNIKTTQRTRTARPRPIVRFGLALLVMAAAGVVQGQTETIQTETVQTEPAQTEPLQPEPVKFDPQLYRQTVDKAIVYLQATQAADGSYRSAADPGATAIITAGLLRLGRSPQDPLVAKSLAYLAALQQADGGIYKPSTIYRNYETCLAIMCLAEANVDGRYDEAIGRAKAFVKDLQWDEGEGHGIASYSHGGGGYGKHRRPDLSNTQMLIDALKSVSSDEDDEALQKALIFVSRCQNLETVHNTSPHSTKVRDGGFYYTVAAGGSSQAGETPDGGLRSYGSMTYAGLKSMIHAGLTAEDQRVKAAFKWIQRHYTLAENPGMGASGLYYYYHTFAKALDGLGEDTITDSDNTKHDWRAELVAELARRQQPDGSWINEQDRWYEGDPTLVTGYVLSTLSYCQPLPQVNPPTDAP